MCPAFEGLEKKITKFVITNAADETSKKAKEIYFNKLLLSKTREIPPTEKFYAVFKAYNSRMDHES